MDQSTSNHKVAYRWLDSGFPVFPIGIRRDPTRPGKLQKRPLNAHGHNGPARNAEEWEKQYRIARGRLRPGEVLGVGLVPGSGGHLVIDVDGTEHVVQWEAAEHGATYTVFTPSGGRHYYFRKRDLAAHVGTRIGFPDADVVRADNGWVVAPGTETPWGSWESHDDFDTDVETCPEHLWAALDVQGRPAEPASRLALTRGLTDVLDRLAAEGRDQDADALRVLCDRYGGHHPYIGRDGGVYVTRPGKPSGVSASVGYVGPGVVKVHTSAWADAAGGCFPQGARLVLSVDGKRLVPADADDGGPVEDLPRFPLITYSQLRAFPRPEFLIEGLLDLDGLGVLYGRRGVYKSFLSLDWVLTITAGLPTWCGHTVRTGAALYVAAEGVPGVWQRVEAWTAANGGAIPAEDRFFVLPEAVNLLSPDAVSGLAELVAKVRPVFVVFDTLARCMPGGEENSAKDVGLAVAHLDLIRRAAGCHVLAVHHSGKDAKQGARGSSALEAAVDSVFTMEGGDGRVRLICTKQKNRPETPPMSFRARSLLDSLVLDIEPGRPSGNVGELSGKVAESIDVLAAISHNLAEGVTWTDWFRAAEDAGIGKSTTQRARTAGIEAGVVHRVDAGGYKAARYRASLDWNEETPW